MAFDPKTWVDGELITAEDLNRLEQAVDATDAALDGKAGTNHTHNIGSVTGLQTALNGKVDDTDPRLTNARTPTDHQHPVADVDGLADRLAALEYRSGIRDVSTLLTPGWTVASAKVWRVGAGITITVNGAGRTTASTGTETLFTLPSGYRPPDTINTRTTRGMTARILITGAVQIVAPGVSVDYFTLNFDAIQAPATTEPGTPA